MSISKLLMAVAVCCINMSTVSTPHGSAASLAGTEDSSIETAMSPSQQRFISHDGTGTTVDLNTAPPVSTDEDDTRSHLSTVSTINPDRLKPALKNLYELLRKLPREVIFPNGLLAVPSGSKPNQLDIIHQGLSNLVEAYKGMVTVATEAQQALTQAQVRLVKAEEARVIWKNSTIVTGTILTVVAGVLINIIRTHGWAIVWGK